MWFNQAKCDIYMGTGAGTKLLKEIGNAQQYVKISSPYLSPKLVDELIWLHKQGVKVSLITSDHLDGGNGRQQESIKPLIVQQRHIDEKGHRMRNRLKKIEHFLKLGILLLMVALLLTAYLTKNWLYVFLISIPMFMYLLSTLVRKTILQKRIYNYDYSSLFPFKVFVTPDSNRINDIFIHGKIYIIDGRTAYLGSLNFTESGTKYNYETRVRITDVEAVKKMDEEFNELYNHPDMAFFGIQEWGSYLYPEPIN